MIKFILAFILALLSWSTWALPVHIINVTTNVQTYRVDGYGSGTLQIPPGMKLDLELTTGSAVFWTSEPGDFGEYWGIGLGDYPDNTEFTIQSVGPMTEIPDGERIIYQPQHILQVKPLSDYTSTFMVGFGVMLCAWGFGYVKRVALKTGDMTG